MNWFFDFDGTLCNTDADIRAAWLAAIREIPLEPVGDFNTVFRNGPSIDEVTRRLYGPDVGADVIEAVRAAFRRHYDSSGFPNTRPYPGIEAWLARLKAAGDRLFIVTNKRFAATNLLVDTLGWRRLFSGVYSSDMFDGTPLGRLKKPALLAEAMRREGADAADSTMVGDTASDIEAGRACGMRTLFVAWGYAETGEGALADAIIREPPRPVWEDFARKAATVLETDPSALSPATRFRELDGWCSLEAFGLMAVLENDFGVRIDIGGLAGAATLGDLFAMAGGGGEG